MQLTWQCVDARSAPFLDLELVCGVPGLQGTDKALSGQQMKKSRGNSYNYRLAGIELSQSSIQFERDLDTLLVFLVLLVFPIILLDDAV
jgi:hypothetical protein